jgi:hypothetical protein
MMKYGAACLCLMSGAAASLLPAVKAIRALHDIPATIWYSAYYNICLQTIQYHIKI